MSKNDLVIVRQALQANEPIPKRILDAPELNEQLELYWCAFFDLDSSRCHANGPMPISTLDVLRYCKYYEFDDCQTEATLYLIRAMDNVHLKRVSKTMDSKIKHNTGG